MVGLPGAGKTTLAKRLEAEHSALRLTPDEWMMPLFGVPELDERRAVLEELLWQVAARMLSLGTSVVLDFGLWGRSERDNYRARAEATGARVELYYLEVTREELWRRVEARNASLPPDTFRLTLSELDECIAMFEPPTAEELASYSLCEKAADS